MRISSPSDKWEGSISLRHFPWPLLPKEVFFSWLVTKQTHRSGPGTRAWRVTNHSMAWVQDQAPWTGQKAPLLPGPWCARYATCASWSMVRHWWSLSILLTSADGVTTGTLASRMKAARLSCSAVSVWSSNLSCDSWCTCGQCWSSWIPATRCVIEVMMPWTLVLYQHFTKHCHCTS